MFMMRSLLCLAALFVLSDALNVNFGSLKKYSLMKKKNHKQAKSAAGKAPYGKVSGPYGGGSGTGCPPGVPVVQCFANPCDVTTCAAHPDANCTSNYCGGCNAVFTDANGQPVNCGCPADQPEVQCFVDPCAVATCVADPVAQCTSNYCGGCNAIFTDENGEVICSFQTSSGQVCTMEAKLCPDGSYVGRDPEHNCEFAPCPTSGSCSSGGCTKDAFKCPDGSIVGRDPNNNCRFRPCPGSYTSGSGSGSQLVCTQEAMECPDGSFVGRDPNNHCRFPPCPGSSSSSGNGVACAQDVRSCPDGSFVSRDPNRGCAFALCPTSYGKYAQGGNGH